MNYQPNALARGLRKNETRSIGVIFPDIKNIFYPEIIRGIEDVFQKDGYTVFVCNTDNDVNKEKKYINTYLEKRVDGLIFIGTRPVDAKKNAHIVKLSQKIPVVVVSELIETKAPDARICCIYSEETKGSYEAVKYLISLGHKKIAFFTSDKNISTYVKKQKGYELALQDSGIPLVQEYIIVEAPYADGGFRATKKMQQLKNKPTAVFAVSDQMAMGVIKAIFEQGQVIPRDLSLIGFSGVSISKDIFPELTTVDQSPYNMGKMASEMMIKLIQDNSIVCQKLPLETKLVIRNSCKSMG
jgi:LacI family transcriptional regulator